MINVKIWDPRLKLTWCLFLVLTALISRNMVLDLVLLLTILITEIITEKSLKRFKVIAILLLIAGSQVLIINLLFGRVGEPVWSWWILTVYNGSLIASLLGFLRICVITISAIQFAYNTDATDIAQMLIKWHIPYRYAMLVPITARFFPVMVNEYHSICDSNSARGVPCDTVMEHIRNLPAAVMPLIYRALRISNDASLSVELRGFGRYETRNFQKTIGLRPFEGIMILFIIMMYISIMLCIMFL